MRGRVDSEPRKAGRLALVAYLRSSKPDIERLVLARTEAVEAVSEFADPMYTRGLRQAIAAAIEYVLGAMESGSDLRGSIPSELLVQARLAARHNVALSVVLQRYIGGYSAISDFVAEAVDRHRAAPPAVVGEASQLIRVLLEETLAAVSAEHAAEERRQARSTEHLNAERVTRLLGGEVRFADNFAYDFHGRHLGIIASGLRAADAIDPLAKAVEARPLAVKPGDQSAWAWLQTSGEIDWVALESAAATLPESVEVAAGEPRQGIVGWRRTHLEARAALALAAHAPGQLVRYGRNELLVAAMNDELLGDSLRDSYLVPLAAGRSAPALKQTVRAYLETGRNASSAAATLGVSRQTVNARVRTAEELIGQPLMKCASALEVALRLDSVTGGDPADS